MGSVFGPCFVMLALVSFSSFAINLTRKRELVALIVFLMVCSISVLWLFLTVPWVGQQCVNVVCIFPEHTQFLYSLT